jgi:hypothetical protein
MTLGKCIVRRPFWSPNWALWKFYPPPFLAMNVLRIMMARTLPMYFHSIGGQHNHIHNDVLVELGREPQQNILFHIYIYIYTYMIIHGTKHSNIWALQLFLCYLRSLSNRLRWLSSHLFSCHCCKHRKQAKQTCKIWSPNPMIYIKDEDHHLVFHVAKF